MVLLPSLPSALLSLVLLSAASAAVSDSASSSSKETYTESLRLNSLPDGKAHSRFQFKLSGPWAEAGHPISRNAVAQHHTLLPTTLTALIHHYRLSSLSLSLSSGRWDSHWPLAPGTTALPKSGIHLEAWLERLEGESQLEERQRWSGLRGALGGVFCASIAQAGVESGKGWGDTYNPAGDEQEHVLYKVDLPALAAPCTESLTPFLSLLPCTNHAGLGSLLNPHRLFDGEWTTLEVHFERTEEGAEIVLEVGAVADPVRQERLRGGLGRREFSLSSLYGRQLRVGCPVASASRIDLVVPNNSLRRFQIEPKDRMTVVQQNGQDLARWDTASAVTRDSPLDVSIKWDNESPFPYPAPNSLPALAISARRLLFFSGQERGKLGIELANNGDTRISVLWSEGWPWWVRGFVSSLESTVTLENGTALNSPAHSPVEQLDYSPPIARERPTNLQARLSVPPRATVRVLLGYESSYLWYTEYPSDAHRGFELPGATLQLIPAEGEDGLTIHTSSTLLSLPTPDFSMPYNVIVLTSTVMALFFGNVMNKLVREWRVVKLHEEGEPTEEK